MLNFINSLTSPSPLTPPNTSSPRQNQLADIKQQVKAQAYPALAASLSNLSGKGGYTEITIFNKNPQIHLFFKTEEERNAFQSHLSEEFKQVSDTSLAFEAWQTPSENDLFPLKLKANQSVALLGGNPLTCSGFGDGKRALLETKKHLELTFLVVGDNNSDVIKNICAWLPLNSVSSFAQTCKSNAEFAVGNESLWQLFAHSEKIPLALNHTSFKTQVMANAALEKGKKFEAAHKQQPVTRFSNYVNYEKAIKYYIEAAKLGSKEARALLTKHSNDIYFVITRLALREILLNSNTNTELAPHDLADVYAKEGVTRLTELGKSGNSSVFEDTYANFLGENSTQLISDALQKILSELITAAWSNNEEAAQSICRIFSHTKNLNPILKAKTEEATSAVIHCSIFTTIGFHSISAFSLFRYECKEYAKVRDIIELKLNNMLNLEPPIQMNFVASSLNHTMVIIVPVKFSDSDRFKEAVLKSELNQSFSPFTELTPGTCRHNCLQFTEGTWNQFKTILLSAPPDPQQRTKIPNTAGSQSLKTILPDDVEIVEDEPESNQKQSGNSGKDNCVVM